jgi:DNA transposition AAA+ family ATPase
VVRQCSDEAVDAVRQDAQRFLASRPDLGPADLSQYSSLAESTVRSFIRGCIPGGREVLREVTHVLAQAKAGEILQPGGRNGAVVLAEDTKTVKRAPRNTHFYQTQVVRRVAEVCDYCCEHSSIGVITGEFGCGKTEALKEWRRAHALKVDSVVFELDEFAAHNKVDFIKTLARMIGVEVSATGLQSGGPVFRSVCDRLLESPMIIFVDQCETARPRIFQVIRQIHDRTRDAGVGVVILSAPILLARMNNSRMADLGAISSRVSIWAPLSGFSKTEMASIVKHEGLTDIEEAAFDMWFKLTGGSMRRLMRAVDLLRAKHSGKRITEKTIAGVAGHLWNIAISEGR